MTLHEPFFFFFWEWIANTQRVYDPLKLNKHGVILFGVESVYTLNFMIYHGIWQTLHNTVFMKVEHHFSGGYQVVADI